MNVSVNVHDWHQQGISVVPKTVRLNLFGFQVTAAVRCWSCLFPKFNGGSFLSFTVNSAVNNLKPIVLLDTVGYMVFVSG